MTYDSAGCIPFSHCLQGVICSAICTLTFVVSFSPLSYSLPALVCPFHPLPSPSHPLLCPLSPSISPPLHPSPFSSPLPLVSSSSATRFLQLHAPHATRHSARSSSCHQAQIDFPQACVRDGAPSDTHQPGQQPRPQICLCLLLPGAGGVRSPSPPNHPSQNVRTP